MSPTGAITVPKIQFSNPCISTNIPAPSSETFMAIRFLSSNTLFPINGTNSSAPLKTSAICNCHLKIEISLSRGERISLEKQVFEDSEIGVICYRDEKGELICEGYDEGPRLTVRPSECIIPKRNARRYNLLRRRFKKAKFNN